MTTSFVPRTRAVIRDTILSSWQSRYRAAGLELLIVRGSDAYMWADSIALELELFEAQAQQLRKEILPDKASTDFLNRHGAVDGVPRKSATKSVLTVRFGCVTSSTVTFGSSLVQAGSLSFTPTASSASDGDADSDVEFSVQCNTAGITGNLSIGATVQWSSTPANSNATGVVIAITTTAVDDESDADYATRIILRRQERPASGNRADWADWCLQVDGVSKAFTIPGYNDGVSTSAFTLGSLSVIVMGPEQGDSLTDTSVLDSTKRGQIADFIEGTRDVSGNVITNGTQLRPVTVKNGNYNILTFDPVVEDIVANITVASAYASTVGSHARVSATTTQVVVAGDRSAYAGKDAVIHIGVAAVRGGYVKARILTAVFGGVNTTLTFATVAATPTNDVDGLCVYPCPLNWSDIRLKVFSYIDALGPYAGTFERYPTEEQASRSTLYRSQLASAILPTKDENNVLLAGVDGVVNVTFTTPAADVALSSPTEKITLNRLKIVQV